MTMRFAGCLSCSVVALASLGIAISELRAHDVPAASEVAQEALLLPRAEENLAVGNVAPAVDLYQDAFAAAPDFESRLALIAPLARALFVNQDLDLLLTDIANSAGRTSGIEDWERSVFHAAAFQLVQDVAAAGRTLLEADPRSVPGPYWRLLREQAALWADDAGDVESLLRLRREAYRSEPGPETHAAYLHAILEAGAGEELREHLDTRRQDLGRDADLWRSLLPALKQSNLLDVVSADLEEAWERSAGEVAVAFALAELRVFEGRLEEATGLFWNIFTMEENRAPVEGRIYFQRLNHFFHNRFAVKNRLGQATDHYGSEMARRFLFLGLRENFDIANIGLARDVSLLYLRELTAGKLSPGEFLDRVRLELDRAPRSPALRILAFAGIGAPGAMADEVATFVDSTESDSSAAEFSLLAMNRYVLSTEKFPELKGRIGQLALGVESKLAPEGPIEVRRGLAQMSAQILRRLGLNEAGNEQNPEESAGPDSPYIRINRAVEDGNPAEAERLYRELREEQGAAAGEDQGLLFLARAWRGQDPQRAAELVAEYLEPLFQRRGGDEVPGPVAWSRGSVFPPPNPYLDHEQLEVLYAAFDIVAGTPAWEPLKVLLQEWTGASSGEINSHACAVSMVLLSWAGEADAAVTNGLACAQAGGDFELELMVVHLLGSQGRFEEAIDVLRGLPVEAPGIGERVRRLLFAMTVANEDGEGAREASVRLDKEAFGPPEILRAAFGLASVGLIEEAAGWIRGVSLEDLDFRDEALYRRTWLQIYMGRGERDRAAGLARFILMGEIPDRFAIELPLERKEALEALVEVGEFDSYQGHLRQLLEFSPHAVALQVLLGESADFRGRHLASGRGDSDRALEEAAAAYRAVVGLRPRHAEMHFELCEWLVAREKWEAAASEYEDLLEKDAQSALLDIATLLEAYRQSGKLPLLVDFLEEWKVPEARSLDEFYGLQPTEHLFRPLGEALLAEENRTAAKRAWQKGLSINPIAFTEGMRTALAELHAADGERYELLELLKTYVAEEDPEPDFYAVQPFATVVPRWLARLQASDGSSPAPVERLMALIRETTDEETLLREVGSWREAMPDRFSLWAFEVYLAHQLKREGWQDSFSTFQERFESNKGPRARAWEAFVEVIW